MSTEEILNLKKLNAAYIAALEYDYCPESKKTNEVFKLLDTGLGKKDLKDSLDDNSGRRPDEIANEISDIIKSIK